MYAILVACDKFHNFVCGQEEVMVETDHKPLEKIFRKPLLQAPMRLQRMLLNLQKYVLNVKYKPGNIKELVLADTLSREFLKKYKETDNDVFSVNMIEILSVAPEKYSEFQKETALDFELMALKEIVMKGWPKKRSLVPNLVLPYWCLRDSIKYNNGIFYKGKCIIVPKTMRKYMLELIHKSHMGIVKCKNRARCVLFWPRMEFVSTNRADSFKMLSLPI